MNEKLKGVTDNLAELESQKQIYDTMAELGTLTESREAEEKVLLEEIQKLKEVQKEHQMEKETLEGILKESQKERFQAKKEQFAKKMELPDDWKSQTQDALNEVGSKVYEAGNQFGSILKKTISSFADAVSENVDWKDINLKVPGLASTKFVHHFNYPEAKATLVDVKLANGDVVILPNEEDDNVKVEANIKIYGKLEDKTPLEALLERSQIEVDDELISFQLPNKKVKADLTFYLPKRTYDHVSVKTLNGDVVIKDFNGKDIYAKSTNGDLSFSNIEASMLELSSVNGNTQVENSQLRDLSIESINGDMKVSHVSGHTLAASGVNGNIRLTLDDGPWKSVEASNVNGDLKIALPKTLHLIGEFKATSGSVKEQLSDIEIKEQRGDHGVTKRLTFERDYEEKETTFVKGSTSSGSIYLKDTEINL